MGSILGIFFLIIFIIIFLRNPNKFLEKMSDWINKHK